MNDTENFDILIPKRPPKNQITNKPLNHYTPPSSNFS